MRYFFKAAALFTISISGTAYGQQVTPAKFFADTSMIDATLSLNINRVLSHRDKEGFRVPATFTYTIPGSQPVTDTLDAELRGHFRRDYCYLPPLRLMFNTKKDASLSKLKALKLVSICKPFGDYDQYIIKEYLVYKIFNVISDMSFRVRLLKINYEDSSGKKKGWTGHAFLLEDIKDLAKRNNSAEWAKTKVATEATNHHRMTLVSIFEYMIGNTDWAVPVDHNIRLLRVLSDSLAVPYAVPYDFDYSGLVNAEYAVPDERLNIDNVQQRLYRGFPRQPGEINQILDIFKEKKDAIYNIINNCDLLDKHSKGDMISYLDGFYKIISDPDEVKLRFITNARVE